MTKEQLFAALSEIDPKYAADLDLIYRRKPSWRKIMKKSVSITAKLVGAAAAAVIALGIIFLPGFFQNRDSLQPGGTQEGVSEVTVCVDKSFLTAAEELLSCYQEVYPDSAPKIKFLPIPAEENEREIFITKTRLEVMSGAGPDAFLVSCADCLLNETEMLFPSPESAMRSRLFYPLDELIAESRFFQKEQLNPEVLAAGRNEQGQVLLPLLYTFPVSWAGPEDAKQADSLSWESLVSSNSESLQMAAELASGYPIGFTFLFPELADWEKDNLLISREELSERIEEKRTLPVLTSIPPNVGARPLSYQLFRETPQDQALTLFPLCGEDGGITAAVTLFAAINANASPEKAAAAFSLFDFMLSDQLVSGEGYYLRSTYDKFTGEETKIYRGGDFYSFKIYSSTGGVDLFLVSGISVKDSDEFLGGSFQASSDEEIETIAGFRDRIQHVRFYSSLDAMLNTVTLELYDKEKSSSELADEIYDRLLIILAEG